MAENITDIESESQIKPVQMSGLDNRVTAYNQLKSSVAEEQGKCGEFIKKVMDTHGVNSQAFKLACGLAKKTPAKRQDFFMTLDAIRAQLEWDDEQGDMLEQTNVVEMKEAAE